MVGVTGPQSVTTGAAMVAVAIHPEVLGEMVRFAGQAIDGPLLSNTITVCWQLFVLPLTSVTVQVTVVVPIGKEVNG